MKQQLTDDDLRRARSWMLSHKEEHRDPKTGELDYTGLTEECCDVLDFYIREVDPFDYVDDFHICEELFEIASKIE